MKSFLALIVLSILSMAIQILFVAQAVEQSAKKQALCERELKSFISP